VLVDVGGRSAVEAGACGRAGQRVGAVEKRPAVGRIVDEAALTAHGCLALVTEERQTLARVNWTAGGRRGASRTTHGQGGSARSGWWWCEGDDAMSGKVGHLAVRALTGRTDRVLARHAPRHQFDRRTVAPTAAAAHPRRTRRGRGRPSSPGPGRQARRTAHVRPAGAGAVKFVVVARTTEGVEAR